MELWGDENYAPNVASGLQRVRRGGYAFLMESPMIEFYEQQRPCDTIRVGGLFDSRGCARRARLVLIEPQTAQSNDTLVRVVKEHLRVMYT